MKRLFAFILVASVLLAIAGCGGRAERKPADEPTGFDGTAHEARVFFVNVGKADCAIVDIDGHIWLVDTGTDESFPNVYAALELMGAESIDGVILTHGHSDHVGGLYAINRRFPVGEAVYPALQNETADLEDAIFGNGIPGRSVKAGDEILVTDDGVRFEVLAPKSLDAGNDNDNSLVLMLRVNGRSVLFTGDMQVSEDAKLTSSGADLTCDVLKVPNHGNPDATSETFAKAADPLIAVVSTDTAVDADSANPAVLAKLSGAEIYLTQDHPLGVLVTIARDGVMSVSFPDGEPAGVSGLAFTEVSKEKQSFTLTNNSAEPVDLSGFAVRSTRGNEVFIFPGGTVIEAGASITVACRNSASAADLIWDEKKAWANSKEDYAVLIDRYGNELARMISE